MTDRETPGAVDAHPDSTTADRPPPGPTPAVPTRGRWVRSTSLGVATNAPSSFAAGAINPVRTRSVRTPATSGAAATPTVRSVGDLRGRAAKVWAAPPTAGAPRPSAPVPARETGGGGGSGASGIPAPRSAGGAGPAGGTSPKPQDAAGPAERTVPAGVPARAGRVPGGSRNVSAPEEAASGTRPDERAETRGRHRRPRRRRVLFAAGGLALAAGVLSLARMAPESMTGIGGGGGPADAEPRGGTATATDPADDAVTTVEAVPPPARAGAATATTVTGDASPTGTSGVSTAPGPSPARSDGAVPAARAGDLGTDTDTGTDAPEPGTTGIPTGPATARPPQAPDPTPTATAPPRAPTPSTQAPAPTHRPGVCVPIVGICVDGLLSPGQRG